MTGQKRTNATGRHRHGTRPSAALDVPPRARRSVGPGVLALCLTGSAALAACGGSGASTTTLRGAVGVSVVAPDGSSHSGVDGERLVAGDVVRTTSAGSALVTGGRVVTLAPSSALALVGADDLRLDAGTVVVDHRHGPAATLVAGPVTVSDLGRTAVRVERGFAVRVADYDGGTVRATAAERSLTLAPLHELAVPGSSLPAASEPLALRDDALDAVASPDLVASDLALVQRAAGLDAPAVSAPTSAAVLAVRTAVLRVLPGAASAVADPGRPLSERVLPVAIARADPRSGDVPTAYALASSLRAGGGSWGVVAALVGASLGRVQDQVTALLDTTADTGLLPVLVGSPATTSGGLSVLLANAGAPAPSGPPPPGGDGSGGTTASAPVTRRTTVAATPTPTPTPLLTSLLGGVLGLLAPTSSRAPQPSATTSAPGLLGGLLGGG